MPTKLINLGLQFNDSSVRVTSKSVRNGLFGFGNTTFADSSLTNQVSSTGTIATDVSTIGTARQKLAAASYGGDKAVFAYGYIGSPTFQYANKSNLVSNLGVITTDSSVAGTLRDSLAAVGYGYDKAIFAYGTNGSAFDAYYYVDISNLVSNTGTISANGSAVGTARYGLAAVGYGGDKGMFAYGARFFGGGPSSVNTVNLVSNTGTIQSDSSGAGTARSEVCAASYGGDKGIFLFGSDNLTFVNYVSNTGGITGNNSTVASGRNYNSATGYGGDKAIVAFGDSNKYNLISNTGVVANDGTIVATTRRFAAAATYGS